MCEIIMNTYLPNYFFIFDIKFFHTFQIATGNVFMKFFRFLL
jgi:hypothetical protein